MRAGLLALVEEAAVALRRRLKSVSTVQLSALALVETLWQECVGGQLSWAAEHSSVGQWGDFSPDEPFFREWNLALAALRGEPTWDHFQQALRLAADLDTFLFVMERHAPVLARDCRDDLDLLGVLADWCDDAGLPHAAAEARYHAERVREWRRGPVPREDTPDRSGWAGVEME